MNTNTFTNRSFSAGSYATIFGLAVAIAAVALSPTPAAPVSVVKLEPVIISAKRLTAVPSPVFKLATVEVSANQVMVQEAIAQGEREANQVAAQAYEAGRI